jgi:hypothetical protein
MAKEVSLSVAQLIQYIHPFYGTLSQLLCSQNLPMNLIPSKLNPVCTITQYLPSIWMLKTLTPQCNALKTVISQKVNKPMQHNAKIYVKVPRRFNISAYVKKTSMVWVRERTTPTERRPLVNKVIANFLRIEDATWSAWRIPTVVFSVF